MLLLDIQHIDVPANGSWCLYSSRGVVLAQHIAGRLQGCLACKLPYRFIMLAWFNCHATMSSAILGASQGPKLSLAKPWRAPSFDGGVCAP